MNLSCKLPMLILALHFLFLTGGRYLYSFTLKKLKDFQEKEAAELLASARYYSEAVLFL